MDEISKIIIDNEYMKCEFFDYESECINPNIEIFRSKCLFKILTEFIEVVTKKLGIEIFSIKKNYIRTLTNIFSSWLFVQYAREDCIQDPIIPSGNITCDTLIITLIDMMKYDSAIVEDKRVSIANEIIETLDLKEK